MWRGFKHLYAWPPSLMNATGLLTWYISGIQTHASKSKTTSLGRTGMAAGAAFDVAIANLANKTVRIRFGVEHEK